MTDKNGTPAHKRILVVDDDQGQRSLLESFLSGQGFAVTTASSGEKALEQLDGGAFDMMISDVRMGGISGLEALHRLLDVLWPARGHVALAPDQLQHIHHGVVILVLVLAHDHPPRLCLYASPK